MDGFQSYVPATKVYFNIKDYHVFLSFRGKDVRMTLVDHLSQALSAAGLEVFVDSQKLKKGEIIGLSLERAIKSSAICIPIFSPGYADSAWCLREAALMLESPGLIIPLFYQMDPTHVRFPQGESSPYQKSFQKHYSHLDRYSKEVIDGWKQVLERICSRSGWSLDMTGGFEARLVKVVVRDIIKTLDRMSLQVAKYPVGLETVKKALLQKSKLNSYETVVRIGLWGIGGIGKTTVAKACYNEIQGNFRAASFVFNVRSASLEKLQGQILKDLVNYEEDVCSVEKGISLLTGRLGGIRALLILDDVDNLEQLDALAGDWLAPGSCLIITSRDKHILNAAHISTGNILQLSGLRKCEGLQLFSWHAFQRKFPIHGYEEISKSIVEACKGHPLSLEVIGSFLYDKKTDTDIDCWTETLQNIAGNRDILKTLKISYSGLSAEEKEIFLDIACFFIGEGTTNPILFWKSMYKTVHTAVTNLSLKLLIKIDKKGVFDMHDLVRDMGRIIAEEERTRQWQPTQPSISFNKVCNINISGLRLFKGDADSLKTLCTPSLRFLQLEHMHIEDVVQILPPSLRWLRMNSCSFPITTDSSNIFNDLILAAKKNCTFLRSRRVWQLRIMDLTDCKSLQILPEPIFNYLSELKSLNFSGYQNLDCLPHSIANLPQLVYLNLSYCERLRYLPEGIGSMLQLEYLNLTSCKLLIELPDSIGNLFRLKHLNLSWCENLKSIPESISMLFKLERLDMLCCYSAWDSIPYAILMQPKLCILGLPPGIVGWRRNTIEEQRTILEPNLFSRKAMAAFRALARSERRILEIFHEKYRSSFSKDTWTRSTDPRFSKDMWTRSTDPRPLGENHFSEDTGRSRTDPRPFNVMN